MNINFILDVSCLWSYIAWRQLQIALRECDIQANISPFPVSSVFFPFSAHTSAAKRARMLQGKAISLLEQSGLSVNFDSLPELSEDLSLCNRLIHTAFLEKKYAVLDDIFQAFFVFGQDISSFQTLSQIARDNGLNPEHLSSAAVQTPSPAIIPEGLRTVPCIILENTSVVFGVQGIPCLKNMLRLSRQIITENPFSKKKMFVCLTKTS